MSVPHYVLAYGWILFVFFLAVILFFSCFYTYRHQHSTDGNICSTIVAASGLIFALATCALIPVDIFLMSSMKTSDGKFTPWANDSEARKSIEDGLVSTYYVLHAYMVVFLFFLLPFAFFYCADEAADVTVTRKCLHALKFLLIPLLMAALILMIGAVVPFAGKPSNGTGEWEEIKNIFVDLETTHADYAMSFMMGMLMLAGMIPLVIYVGCGMAIWPMDLFKGRREGREVEGQMSATSVETSSIQSGSDETKSLLRSTTNSWRPFEILFGVFLLVVALLIFVSLLWTDIQKIMHSHGPWMGYILPSLNLTNPIDTVLVYAQEVFPLDYFLIIGLIFFLFFCAMSAFEMIGICNCFPMFKIRWHETRPQGLLMLCFLLMLILLAMNVLIYEMAPQYVKFGSQKYIVNETTVYGNITQKIVPCTSEAPHDECVMTRMSMFLYRSFYKFCFFGAAYYWASWVFLAMFLLAFVFSVIRKPREINEQANSATFISANRAV